MQKTVFIIVSCIRLWAKQCTLKKQKTKTGDNYSPGQRDVFMADQYDSLNKQTLHYCHLAAVCFLFAELPYGWEKIDDPIYGSYYVE